MHSGSASFFYLRQGLILNAFFAGLLRVAASCISLAATFLQKSPVRSLGCPPSCGARLRPRRQPPCRSPTAAPTSPRCIPRRGRSDVPPTFCELHKLFLAIGSKKPDHAFGFSVIFLFTAKSDFGIFFAMSLQRDAGDRTSFLLRHYTRLSLHAYSRSGSVF